MKQELINYGISENKIIEDRNSVSTYQQLVFINKYIAGSKKFKLGIISNRYHIPRIKAMINHCPDLASLNNASIISAEDVALTLDPSSWESAIQSAYESEAMKERIRLESNGVREIENGTYIFK